VTVLIIPGKSTTVKSHASGDTNSIFIEFVENPVVPVSHNELVNFVIMALNALTSVTGNLSLGDIEVDLIMGKNTDQLYWLL
jgi:hypothetical protein